MGTERTVAEPGQASSSRGFQRGRLAVSLVALLLGLVPAGSVHPQSPTPSPGDGLWVASVNGLAKVSLVDGAVLLRIAEPRPVRLVAVDDASGRVWAFATDTLVAFDPTGQRLLGVPVPPAPLTSLLHQALAVDPATGGVWLALAQRLYRFDAAGRLLVTAGLPDLVQGLAVDPAGARLWVAIRSSVAPYDAGGHRGSPLDLGGRRDVESVAIDQASGDLWVGLRDGLRRHRAAGSLLFEVPIGGLAHLADDGASGLWTATLNRLRRLDPAGHVLVEHRPFADGIVITAVAPDPSDHSVWVSGLLTLLHFGAAGQRLTGPTTPDLILDLALLRPAGAANQPPVARDDTATTPEDAAVTIPAGQSASAKTAYHVATFGTLGGLLIERLWE
jgi:catechol 2,3-dioxygenase-like lactoylglutathione lyase family enzyme